MKKVLIPLTASALIHGIAAVIAVLTFNGKK